MSSASLASHRACPSSLHPDRVRIAALSVAMAMNLAVFLAALRPLEPLYRPPAIAPPELRVRLGDTPKPQPLPPPPPIQLQPLSRSHPTPITHVPVTTPVPPSSDEGRVAPPVAFGPTLLPAAVSDPPVHAAATPVQAELAYRAAPLAYPVAAIRQRMHGTVLLRVLVDEQGRPVEVAVVHGSGHALLDRSAREQVLAGWRFKPALIAGRPVRAWANVPVTFDLQTF